MPEASPVILTEDHIGDHYKDKEIIFMPDGSALFLGMCGLHTMNAQCRLLLLRFPEAARTAGCVASALAGAQFFRMEFRIVMLSKPTSSVRGNLA